MSHLGVGQMCIYERVLQLVYIRWNEEKISTIPRIYSY